jgi:uncharacterized SAM-binding protein YcdF (DUF218 family)
MAKKLPRGCLSIAGILLVMIAVSWASRVWILTAMGEWLDVGVPPQRADYAMILTGDENTRPFAAAALVQAGWARQALASHVKNLPGMADDDELCCNETIRRVMLRQGVPPDKFITLPGAATTTFDEAQVLAAFLESHPDAKVLIVTNHYHTRRARWIFTRVLPSSVTVSMISVPTDGFELREWWKNENSWLTVASEYLKLVFYDLRYGYYWIVFLSFFLGLGGIFVYFRYFRHRSTRQKTSATDVARASSP